MNFRKLLDWRSLLIYSHRWMGIVFGIVFIIIGGDSVQVNTAWARR